MWAAFRGRKAPGVLIVTVFLVVLAIVLLAWLKKNQMAMKVIMKVLRLKGAGRSAGHGNQGPVEYQRRAVRIHRGTAVPAMPGSTAQCQNQQPG